MTTTDSGSHRGTIFVEEAKVLEHTHHAGAQHTLRVYAPECAARAQPGSFVHLSCDPALPMRRPMSIMAVDSEQGWVEMLYKAVGRGTKLLAQREIGETLSMMGPIGKTFELHAASRRPLLIGGGVGIPPMVFIAEHLRAHGGDFAPFVIMGSEVPFPFETARGADAIAGIPASVDATMPRMDALGFPSRLASLQGYAGCFNGYVTELARVWLDALSVAEREQVEIFSCGPTPMLKAVAALAQEYHLPCQISLEEYMACAVGGCAGCTVLVQTEDGPAMKRVCVDGPVFDATQVFPGTA